MALTLGWRLHGHSGTGLPLIAGGLILVVGFSTAKADSETANTDCGMPLQTLVDAAAAGSTLNVPACTYREAVTINKSLALIATPGAEIRGSDVWNDWTPAGDFWTQGPVPALGNQNGVCASDVSCQSAFEVFVDGHPLGEVTGNPSSGEFAIDARRDIVLADDPKGHIVEVSTRSTWLSVHADNVTVDGFTMQHAANEAQRGALIADGGSHVTVRNATLAYAHGVNVQFLNGSEDQLLDSDIHHAGQLGVSAYQTTRALVQGNRIHDNNTAGFDPYWEAGGLKISSSADAQIVGNEVYANSGQGLWCDLNCQNVSYAQNRVHDNSHMGIVFEVSRGGRIIGNTLWNNGSAAAPGWSCDVLVTGSSDADVADNTVLSAQPDASRILVVSQDRPDAPNGGLVANVSVHDNAVVTSSP